MLLIATIVIFFQGTVIACTGFTAQEGDLVLFGNNEDWYDPDPYIRVHPAEQDKYGRLYIEFGWPPENPRYYVSFTGINNQGLCFDSFLHPKLVPTESSHKPRFNGDLMEFCMERCSTVEEVIAIFDQYNLDFMANFQYFIVDHFGNSAIIEGDEVVYKEGSFQVVTNFLHSNPEHGWYPCWRYETAVNMLENMQELTVEYFTDICDATHQEGTYPTVYSYVNDLQNNIMYLYHYYNFDNVVILDVNEEIAQGEHEYYLPDLFTQEQNNPPNTPNRPSGPSTGNINREYTYSTKTTDPDGDRVLYLFDWGDNTDSGWVGPYDSDEIVRISHDWSKQGSYEVKVKAKDIYGGETDWSEPLPINMPKSKNINRFFLSMIEKYNYLLQILEYLFNHMMSLFNH
jgi:choloylglycine hydrolase